MYSSCHGSTKELSGLHEFGYFWNRFFKQHYQESVDSDTGKLIENEIHGMMNTFGKDIMFKNLTCGLRIKVLKKIFPTAKYIVVKRDPMDICISLLEGRSERGSINKFWSLRPKQINSILKLKPHEQVAAQVNYIYKQITEDIIGQQYIEISYKDLCINTEQVIKSVQKLGLTKRQHVPKFNLVFKKREAEKEVINKIQSSLEKFR